MMEESFVEKVTEHLDIMMKTRDPDVKFRASVQMLRVIFDSQKHFLVSIRDLVKNKKTLNEKEVLAIKSATESLIGGVNVIQSLYETILKKEYKVN